MKKGQVSTFVLIGFVIILFVAMYILITGLQELREVKSTISIDQKIAELKEELQECIKVEVNNALKIGNVNELNGTKINCEVQKYATEGYELIEKGNPTLLVEEKEDGVYVTINYPIEIIKDGITSRLEPYEEFYGYTSLEKLAVEEGRLLSTTSISTVGEGAILTIPNGTKVSNNDQSLQIESEIIDVGQNNFDPWSALLIYYPKNENVGIVEARTNKTIPTAKINDYLTAKITNGGKYFVGNCDDFICCWNGICDQSENEVSCPEEC